MHERKYRGFHNTKIKHTTIHEPYCSSYINRNVNTTTGTWQEGTREEIEAEAKRLSHKVKSHTFC